MNHSPLRSSLVKSRAQLQAEKFPGSLGEVKASPPSTPVHRAPKSSSQISKQVATSPFNDRTLASPLNSTRQSKYLHVLSPERVHTKKKTEMNTINEQYRDIEDVLKSAQELSSGVSSAIRLSEITGSWKSPVRHSSTENVATTVIHVDKGAKDSNYDSRHVVNETPNYRLLLIERDSEIHLLKQNYDLLHQESVMLKQQLIRVMESYEHLEQENELMKKYQMSVVQQDSELYTLKQNYELQYQESVILKQKLMETIQTVDHLEKENQTLRKQFKADTDLQYQSFRAYDMLHSSLENLSIENQRLLGNLNSSLDYFTVQNSIPLF